MSLNGSAGLDSPVAVDAMGGDLGLEVQVEGAVQAFKEFGVRSILVGPESELKNKINSLGAATLPIEIQNATQVVEMTDSPTRAVRRKPDSSLCVAYRLVEERRAGAVISAGNSGAMMAAGLFLSGLLPGIERPAIATLIPVVGSGLPTVILDAGANVDCHARHLVQFAAMGAVYCNSLLNVSKPKVALLSNGAESSKGTDVVRAAAGMLKQMGTINYVGYVEGRDIGTPAADVIVCDGFVGNVVLKAMEGCVRLVGKELMHEAQSSLVRKMGLFLLKDAFKHVFREKFDYTSYGGAPLLGLRQLGLVMHGSSNARAVKNAIRIANDFAKLKMVEKLGTELSRVEEMLLDLDEAASGAALGTGNKGFKLKNGESHRAAAEKGSSEDGEDA